MNAGSEEIKSLPAFWLKTKTLCNKTALLHKIENWLNVSRYIYVLQHMKYIFYLHSQILLIINLWFAVTNLKANDKMHLQTININ